MTRWGVVRSHEEQIMLSGMLIDIAVISRTERPTTHINTANLMYSYIHCQFSDEGQIREKLRGNQ